jgi:hypothetical protein
MARALLALYLLLAQALLFISEKLTVSIAAHMPPNATLNELLAGYMRGTGFSPNDEHALMSGIISQMATALQDYCNSKGIVLFHERAENLFWAGLTNTPTYTTLSSARKDLISRENSAEQQNTNVPSPATTGLDITPQGKKACN